jgi:hypothetical protein
MRIRTVLLMAAPAVAAGVAAAGAFATAPPAPPGADYPWAQPNAALPTESCTQPSIRTAFVVPTVPTCSYAWAQPGTAPVSADWAQPPASVPAYVPAGT